MWPRWPPPAMRTLLFNTFYTFPSGPETFNPNHLYIYQTTNGVTDPTEQADHAHG